MEELSSPLSFDSNIILSLSPRLPELETVRPDNPEGASETSWKPLPHPPMAEVFPSTLNYFEPKKFRRLYNIPKDIVLRTLRESKQACHI